jgi:hypothetical protein
VGFAVTDTDAVVVWLGDAERLGYGLADALLLGEADRVTCVLGLPVELVLPVSLGDPVFEAVLVLLEVADLVVEEELVPVTVPVADLVVEEELVPVTVPVADLVVDGDTVLVTDTVSV